MDYNFREKIEFLLSRDRRTKKSLYDFLGMTMQGFDSMMKNNTFTATRLGKVADFFGTNVSYFYGDEAKPANRSADGGAFGEQVADRLFEEFTKLREQLNVKDKQLEAAGRTVEGLQRTVDALLSRPAPALGKPNGVTAHRPVIIIHPSTLRVVNGIPAMA